MVPRYTNVAMLSEKLNCPQSFWFLNVLISVLAA